MLKLCAFSAYRISAFRVAPFFYVAAVLGLVACGGQAVKPVEEEVAVEKAVQEPVEVKSEAPAQAAEPVVEPEPVVEVMPQKQVDEPQIAVEPIPAKEAPVESAEKETAVEPADPAEAVTAEAAAPAVAAPAAEEPTKPVSAGANHFVITVGPKEPSHPAYGKGHSMGFLVDGVSGKELVVERGKTYTFEIITDPKHDVYLSKKAVGWGGAPFADGVEGAYTYKGTMTLKVDENTPDQLFYACRNHPYMGAMIHVVDKGQKVDIKQQTASSKAERRKKAAAVSESKVKQKIMFAEMMIGGQGAKRVLASQNDEAKQLLSSAKQKLSEGREKSKSGALTEALALATQSLKLVGEASALVPGEEEMAQLAERYKSSLTEIKNYQKSYNDNIKRLEKSGGVTDEIRMDEKKLAATLAKAKTLAEQKNYVHANKLLKQAQEMVTGALHKMLDSKTIVYDLKFDSPADEYEYELKRFTGYEELIPVAIEAKKPAPGAIKLMESFLSKARSRRDEAVAKAEAGDYPTAISMLLQATKTVRRALRMVGVTQ
jgi:hypothetical protein